MASITKLSNGRKAIQFVGADGKRYTIRPGKMTMRDAEVFRAKVERLLSAKVSASGWDNETARWVA